MQSTILYGQQLSAVGHVQTPCVAYTSIALFVSDS